MAKKKKKKVAYEKQVAERRCQYPRQLDGRAITADKGSIHLAPKGFPNFRPLGKKSSGFSFETATMEELLEAECTNDEIETFIRDTYGIEPQLWPEKNKRDWVEELLDARYRNLSEADTNPVDVEG